MKNQAQTLASVIARLDSSLKNRILMSGAFKLGGKAIGLVEKLNRMDVAEQKYGRRVIDPSTGQPQADTLRIQLEEVLAAYGAIMDEGGDQLATIASLDAIVAGREQPFVRVLTDEQLRLRADISQISIHQVQSEHRAKAVAKADAFSKKAGEVLGELESALCFAPNWELADIPAELWDMAETVESAIKRYRAAVATGQIWDETDMVLAKADIDALQEVDHPRAQRAA